MNIFVGITGASGVRYGLRLIEVLSLSPNTRIQVSVSDAGLSVFSHETCTPASATGAVEETLNGYGRKGGASIEVLDPHDLSAPPSSGSHRLDAVFVCPCSMSTLGNIAGGTVDTLIHRVAEVALKERIPLVVVPRETPLSLIHIENMERVVRAGAHVVPAMPAFYHCPETIDDLIDFVVGKVLDVVGIPHQLFKRWGADVVD